MAGLVAVAFMVLLVVCPVGVVARYRRADRVVRAQVKGLALGAAALLPIWGCGGWAIWGWWGGG